MTFVALLYERTSSCIYSDDHCTVLQKLGLKTTTATIFPPIPSMPHAHAVVIDDQTIARTMEEKDEATRTMQTQAALHEDAIKTLQERVGKRDYPFVRSIWCSDHWRPPETVKMTSDECCDDVGGALIRGPRNATTIISVQSRSFERHLCTFCKGFRQQIDRSAFFVKM
jgi:hypothetical protein